MSSPFGRAALAAALVALLAAPSRAADPEGAAPKTNDAANASAAPAQPAVAHDEKDDGELVDGIVAQVGTEVVLRSEVDRVAKPMEQKVRAKGGTDADIQMMRSDILDKLIERKLVALVAKRAEVDATDFEVDDAIANIAKENQLDLEGLKKSVAAEGLAWDVYRQRVKEEIIQHKVLNGMVRSRVKVEESQIRKLYDQRYGAMPAAGGQELHLVHMAVGAEDGKPASVKAACEKVRRGLARVRNGEDFVTVATEVSQASPDLGWLPQNALAPWMQNAVGHLEPGQVSDVIELPVGCAVLTLVERRTIEPLSYDQAKGQLRELLAEQAFQDEYVKFIDRIRRQTYVDRRGEFANETASVSSPPPIH
jgi:peptidyl-prolyl cis-trans isomerase SurA